jgi:hypothetical protein
MTVTHPIDTVTERPGHARSRSWQCWFRVTLDSEKLRTGKLSARNLVHPTSPLPSRLHGRAHEIDTWLCAARVWSQSNDRVPKLVESPVKFQVVVSNLRYKAGCVTVSTLTVNGYLASCNTNQTVPSPEHMNWAPFQQK